MLCVVYEKVLNVAGDVKELVEVKAQASFDKYAKDLGTNAQGPHKALLAPKGQYWDTPADKVYTQKGGERGEGQTRRWIIRWWLICFDAICLEGAIRV